MNYHQAFTRLFPKEYADLAIQRIGEQKGQDGLLREHDKTNGSFVGTAFTWMDTPEGENFWSAVRSHELTGSDLPPIPK